MSDKNKKKQAQPEQCQEDIRKEEAVEPEEEAVRTEQEEKGGCLLYTSDAADD